MSGNCPQCEKIITYKIIEQLETNDIQKAYKGLSFKCPHCSTRLRFQINPFTLKTALVKKIKGS